METLVLSTFLLWFGLAIIVGVAANTRGRSGFGWFVFAILLSPLISGLLLLALPRVERVTETEAALSKSQPAFSPEGVIKGFPYRLLEDGTVDAMMTGGLVRFRDMEQFRAAAEGRDAPPPSRVDKDADYPDVMDGIRYKINDDDTVTAKTPMGERTYSNWDSFLRAT